jgi:hypothetical protein
MQAVVDGFSVHLVKLLLKGFPKSSMVQDDNDIIPLHHVCANNIASDCVYVVMIQLNARTPSQLLKTSAIWWG